MEILKLDVLLRKEPFKVALPSRCDDGRGGGTKKKTKTLHFDIQIYVTR